MLFCKYGEISFNYLIFLYREVTHTELPNNSFLSKENQLIVLEIFFLCEVQQFLYSFITNHKTAQIR